jgi:hypothetical protein
VKGLEQPKQAELTKHTERKEAEQMRATERKIDPQKPYAERKKGQGGRDHQEQRQLEEQGEPAKPELANDRVEEPPNLFENLNAPLWDRPSDVAPVLLTEAAYGRSVKLSKIPATAVGAHG